MNHRIDVPFVGNWGDGRQCLQVGLCGVLRHFLGRDVPLGELDRLTGRPAAGWTWTPQFVWAAYDLGLDVRFRSTLPLAPQLAGETFIRAHYPDEAEFLIRETNVAALQTAVRRLLDLDVFEEGPTTAEDLAAALAAGFVPLAMVDAAKLYGMGAGYLGHLVTVTGLTADHVIYHEPGPANAGPHREFPLSEFLAAMHAPNTDNDVVIVRGARPLV